jgi:hypothetical protein
LSIGFDTIYCMSGIGNGLIDSDDGILNSSIVDIGPYADWWFGRYPVIWTL